MSVLVYTDRALHNIDADPDEEGSNNEWLAKAKKGIRVRSQHDALVCVVAQDDLKKKIGPRLEPKRAHVEMLLTLPNTRDHFGARS